MSNSERFHGRWWLPIRPTHRVSGELRISDEGVPELTLAEPLVTLEFLALPNHEVIFGEVSRDRAVTLHGCHTTRVDGNLVDIVAGAALVGGYFPAMGDVQFHTLSVDMESLENWLRPREYIRCSTGQEPGSLVVRPSQGAPVEHLVRWRDYEITLHASGAEVVSEMRTLTVRPSAYLSVHSASERPFADLFGVVKAIRQLVSLGLGTSAKVRALYGGRRSESNERGENVRVYSPQLPVGQGGAEYSFELFTTETLGDRIGEVITRWLDASERLRPVYDLIFSPYERSAPVAELRFLELIQALEAHHRLQRGGRFMEPEVYRERVRNSLVRAIPSDIEPDLREAIINRVRYGYQYSLRRRLRELLRGHPPERVFCDIRDAEQFIDDVVVLRNYLTHFDEGDMTRASAVLPRIRVLSEQLHGILTILLLRDLGFDDEGVRSLAASHPQFLGIQHLRWVSESQDYLRRLDAAREAEGPTGAATTPS